MELSYFQVPTELIIARFCGDPTFNITSQNQEYKDGPSSPGSPSEGSVWTVKCTNGYRWEDYSTSKVITCDFEGKWTLSPACISEGVLSEKSF